MSVLYWDNCWFTNVGEAFIDIGAMNLLSEIFPSETIINMSKMNWYYIQDLFKEDPYPKLLKMWDYIGGEAKYLVFAGMHAWDQFLATQKEIRVIEECCERGIELIFLGLGQAFYTNEETEHFSEFLRRIRPKLVVSRDNVTYEHFKDVVPCIKGIDCAFWVGDSYDPSNEKVVKEYDIVSYNRSEEPQKIFSLIQRDFVRAWHFQYSAKKSNIKDYTLISDSPYDYLTLYANATDVYTDLVHATIASLQYGKHVLFEGVDNRAVAIEALENLRRDERGMLYIEKADLEIQKKRVLSEIKSVLC